MSKRAQFDQLDASIRKFVCKKLDMVEDPDPSDELSCLESMIYKSIINAVLEHESVGGNIAMAARILGISRATFYKRMSYETNT